ncbi:MAG: cobalt ECF transporter T component CbiQ [Mycobacteriales bacterium]
MSAGHAHAGYVRRDSPVHRLPPECKLLAAVAFVLVVVSTPRTWYPAFGGYALLLAGVAAAAGVPLRTVLRRTAVEAPFVAFALLLPFVARGERVAVLGVAVSRPGLLGAGNLLAKATLGVVTSILLVATTEQRSLLVGLERLRLPARLVQIASFMLRYADVVTGELRRMRIARESRCFTARSVRGWRTLGHAAGALFVRCYERGERVHLAMLARGYTGTMPALAGGPAPPRAWATAFALPVAAGALLALGGVLR